jgi:hypothetical protein
VAHAAAVVSLIFLELLQGLAHPLELRHKLHCLLFVLLAHRVEAFQQLPSSLDQLDEGDLRNVCAEMIGHHRNRGVSRRTHGVSRRTCERAHELWSRTDNRAHHQFSNEHRRIEGGGGRLRAFFSDTAMQFHSLLWQPMALHI